MPCSNDLFLVHNSHINMNHHAAIFSGTECVIEKVRAKHDGYNSGNRSPPCIKIHTSTEGHASVMIVMAGCATGGALAARAGPEAMAMG